MSMRFSTICFLALLVLAGLFSCESRKSGKEEKPVPQVFTPEADAGNEASSDSSPIQNDNVNGQIPLDDPKPMPPAGERKPMPTVAELKKITPSQEAKRALSNDAMQIYRMKPEAFKTYMQSRIPYYKGKGDLKTENDMVRIEINAREMRVQTPKDNFSFSMQ